MSLFFFCQKCSLSTNCTFNNVQLRKISSTDQHCSCNMEYFQLQSVFGFIEFFYLTFNTARGKFAGNIWMEMFRLDKNKIQHMIEQISQYPDITAFNILYSDTVF